MSDAVAWNLALLLLTLFLIDIALVFRQADAMTQDEKDTLRAMRAVRAMRTEERRRGKKRRSPR